MDQAEIARWTKATALLEQILDLPAKQQVQAAGELGLEHGVSEELGLLLNRASRGSILDLPLEEFLSRLPAWEAREINLLKGRVIGQWLLGDEIGRGGMSVVYNASRISDDFEQHAALKILSVAHLGRGFVESFLRERQILSDLHHRGIAGLIDGGLTPDGAPFLVMQRVQGERIDRWCKVHNASLRTIAGLMLELCHAVAYAQRHLVVHQDINPSNVLVDEHGQPVLIDFGIASLLGDTAAERRLHAFTRDFAAPEQQAGQKITTATDVYALGKLFLALLAGQQLGNKLDSDLQLVLECATREDPEQRYASARNLASDIEAWMAKRPIQARPSSFVYRAGRFLDRNRLGTAAAALVVISILGGLGVSIWQAEVAARERDMAQMESARATQVTHFLQDLFRASDPDRAQGEAVNARDLLDQGAHQARVAFDQAPALKAEMLVLLGHLYNHLGETEAAAPLLEEGLQLADAVDDLDLRVDARHGLAQQQMDAGNHERALELAEEAEVLLEQAGRVPGRQHASLMESIVFSMAEMGRAAEAAQRGAAALQLARLKADLPMAALYDYLLSTGKVMLVAEQVGEAEALFSEAANLGLGAADNPSKQIALHADLAGMLARKGDISGSWEHQQLAMSIADRIYQPTHVVRARQLSNSGSALIGMGRYREAESLLREALEIYAIHYGSGPHPRVAAAENNLARALLLAGDYDASAAHMIRARELAEQLFGTRDPRFVVATGNLGDLERRRGNLQRAEELLIENLELRRTLLGGEHRSVGNGLALLANLRLDQGRWESALQLCDEALALFNRVGFESPETLIATHTRRARALAGLGRMDEADTALEETLSIAQAAPDDAGMSWLELLSARARFLQGQRDSRAPEAIRQALDEHRRMLGAEHPTTQQLQAWSEPDLENAPQVR